MTLQEITFIGTYTYTAQDFRDTARRCSTAGSARSTGPKPAAVRGPSAFEDYPRKGASPPEDHTQTR
jgi:hypothetical protein